MVNNANCIVSISYGSLAGVALWCSFRLRSETDEFVWLYLSYFFIILNSISGILRDEPSPKEHESKRDEETQSAKSGKKGGKGSKSNTKVKNSSSETKSQDKHSKNHNKNNQGDFWDQTHFTTNYLNSLYALPGLVTQFLINNSVPWPYAFTPIGLTVFPLLVYFIDNVRDNSMLDCLIIGNAIFLTAFSTHFGCEIGIVAAIVYCLTHFILRLHRLEDSSKEIVYNVGVAIFCILALLTLGVDLYKIEEL